MSSAKPVTDLHSSAASGPRPVTPETGVSATVAGAQPEPIDWKRCAPFVAVHLVCLGVLVVGVSPFAIVVAIAMYAMRMFAVTAFYHRYFSHRAFKTSRLFQFLGAFAACTAGQRGPLWWASQHRHHHNHSDTHVDAHSPRWYGFLYSHTGWFLTKRHYPTDESLVRDWQQFPELRWLDRFDWVPPFLLAAALLGLGSLLARVAPALGTDGPQLLIWGFFVSTVVLYHATYTINSLAHRIGKRPYDTGDDSRNNGFLALLTFGEGWHNNHHYYPASARQGFRWWEIDLSYYALIVLSWVGLVWGLRPVPSRVLAEARPAGSART